MDNDTAENITIVKLNPCKFSVALTPRLKDKMLMLMRVLKNHWYALNTTRLIGQIVLKINTEMVCNFSFYFFN
jgi:hypothetical protein